MKNNELKTIAVGMNGKKAGFQADFLFKLRRYLATTEGWAKLPFNKIERTLKSMSAELKGRYRKMMYVPEV